jgi:signal peptidase I
LRWAITCTIIFFDICGKELAHLDKQSIGKAPQDQGLSTELSDEMVSPLDGAVPDAETEKRRGKLYPLREIIETVLLTVVIFVAINTVTGRFRIEGPSMMPNLQQGQYVIINKIVYRLDSPQRGDIIVFRHPLNPSRDLIKRIIGLPGETIEISNGQVQVDGVPLEEPYVLYESHYSVHYELGPDDYFVLGDNRPNSDDSHNWGTLERDQIVGKAWISYWPPATWGGLPHFDYGDTPPPEAKGWNKLLF